MKRLFIAVPIREKARMQIVRGILNQDAVRKMPVRWTPYENLHLTIRFLGDVEEKRIPELKEVLDNCGISGQENLCFANVGAFPNPAAARIIWLGFKKCAPLQDLERRITSGLSQKDFPFDRKSFKPHLTIGRVRDNAMLPAGSFAWLEKLIAETQLSETPLDRVTLFESQLRPGGPVYTPLYEKNLCSS